MVVCVSPGASFVCAMLFHCSMRAVHPVHPVHATAHPLLVCIGGRGLGICMGGRSLGILGVFGVFGVFCMFCMFCAFCAFCFTVLPSAVAVSARSAHANGDDNIVDEDDGAGDGDDDGRSGSGISVISVCL